ncbi:MAG: NUDIX hydrolase [Mesorhizobium amorphae]|nr:MAG: NUDIX hydrolase [Mesorhizobium amorphae]
MSQPVIEKTETLFGGWGKYLRVHLRFPDGTAYAREIEDHGDAACVLPFDAARGVVMLVRQARAPLVHRGENEQLWEAPAGILDEPDPAECARREAMEEVGLRLGEVVALGSFWTMPGISAERMHLFLAPYGAADRVTAGGGLADENEAIEVVEMPIREAAELMDGGRMRDMKTFALLQALRLRHPELFAGV